MIDAYVLIDVFLTQQEVNCIGVNVKPFVHLRPFCLCSISRVSLSFSNLHRDTTAHIYYLQAQLLWCSASLSIPQRNIPLLLVPKSLVHQTCFYPPCRNLSHFNSLPEQKLPQSCFLLLWFTSLKILLEDLRSAENIVFHPLQAASSTVGEPSEPSFTHDVVMSHSNPHLIEFSGSRV